MEEDSTKMSPSQPSPRRCNDQRKAVAFLVLLLVSLTAYFLVANNGNVDRQEKIMAASRLAAKPHDGHGDAHQQQQQHGEHPTKKDGFSLLLLRHAKSSWDDVTLADFDRPLAPRGVVDATRLGRILQRRHLSEPDVIYSSPSVRTRATLQLVQRHWATHVPVEYCQELYDLALTSYYWDWIVEKLQDTNTTRIMLVGHNPAMQALHQDLVAVSDDKDSTFPTAGFCQISWSQDCDWSRLEQHSGRQDFLINPHKQL